VFCGLYGRGIILPTRKFFLKGLLPANKDLMYGGLDFSAVGDILAI
jgi:hypothetical protein